MELIRLILIIVQYVFYVYLALATIYIFAYSFAGLFYKQKQVKNVSKYRKFAVLIPGYKEDLVILNVAKEALNQNYPKDKFEVIVIADSFQSDTLEALRKLPIRVEEVVFMVSKKSKALNKCMDAIGDDYDIAFVLDADNMMNHDVLRKINAAFDRGFIAVQGHRTAKNLNGNFAILDAISEEINNHIFRKGHRVLGISSALIGSGMGIDYHLFKTTMATVDSVGEDKEVELKIIRQRHAIEYVHDALIFDEKTQKSDVFVNQRRRWIAAQIDYFRTHFLDGFVQFITKGNFDYFDKVLQMVQPPRILLTGILFVVIVLEGIVFYFGNSSLTAWFQPGFLPWVYLLTGTVLALLFAIPRRFYNKTTAKALLSLPYGFFLMLVSLFKVKGATQNFIHTEHSHIDDIKHN